MELKKGETIMMDIDLDNPAATFYEAVSIRLRIPIHNFALYYQSKKLEGEAALASWGVTKDATIEVKTRGRGGVQMHDPDMGSNPIALTLPLTGILSSSTSTSLSSIAQTHTARLNTFGQMGAAHTKCNREGIACEATLTSHGHRFESEPKGSEGGVNAPVSLKSEIVQARLARTQKTSSTYRVQPCADLTRSSSLLRCKWNSRRERPS